MMVTSLITSNNCCFQLRVSCLVLVETRWHSWDKDIKNQLWPSLFRYHFDHFFGGLCQLFLYQIYQMFLNV